MLFTYVFPIFIWEYTALWMYLTEPGSMQSLCTHQSIECALKVVGVPLDNQQSCVVEENAALFSRRWA